MKIITIYLLRYYPWYAYYIGTQNNLLRNIITSAYTSKSKTAAIILSLIQMTNFYCRLERKPFN